MDQAAFDAEMDAHERALDEELALDNEIEQAEIDAALAADQ